MTAGELWSSEYSSLPNRFEFSTFLFTMSKMVTSTLFCMFAEPTISLFLAVSTTARSSWNQHQHPSLMYLYRVPSTWSFPWAKPLKTADNTTTPANTRYFEMSIIPPMKELKTCTCRLDAPRSSRQMCQFMR